MPQRAGYRQKEKPGRSRTDMAESEGFEPPIPLRVLLISNQVPSAARPALLNRRFITPQRWRRGWDSNPRYVAVYTLSKRAPSAARPPLQSLLLPPLAEELP